MKVRKLELEGAMVISAHSSADERGTFLKAFSRLYCDEVGVESVVDQVNVSHTVQDGTIRGLHFQHPPYAEAKFITCVSGKVFDVVVDIRAGSPTFLHWHSEVLSQRDKKIMFVPKGFAHGFQTLETDSTLLYIHCGEYRKESEGGICYCDEKLQIEWPKSVTRVSDRDRTLPTTDQFAGVKL